MNYCRQCHTYYPHGESCGCPSPQGAQDRHEGAPGGGASMEVAVGADGRRIPYPAGRDAVRTGLFD